MDNNNTDKVEGDQLPHSQSQNESHSLATTGLFSLPNPSFPQSRSPRRIRTETSESFARILVATTFATAELIEVSQDGLHFKTEKTPDILYQNRPIAQLAIDDDTRATIVTKNCDRLKLCDKDFRCPISQWEFTQPVIANDGKVYERDAIEKYIKTNAKRSTFTNGSKGWCVQSPLRIGVFTSKSGTFVLKHARKISQQMNEWIWNANQVKNQATLNTTPTEDVLSSASLSDKRKQPSKSDDSVDGSPCKRLRFDHTG